VWKDCNFMRIFPFLNSFDTDDAPIFFGREREIEMLVDQIERDPLVVVNGLSGCGKSSAIRAGVMPRLMVAKRRVIYATATERVNEDVLTTIRDSAGIATPVTNWVQALQWIYDHPEQDQESSQAKLLTQLRETLIKSFSKEELHTLCSDLGCDPETLPYTTKGVFAREFVSYLERRDEIPNLVEECVRLRPNVPWRSIVDAFDPIPDLTKSALPGQGIAGRPIARRPAVLIIDQFERALSGPHAQEEVKTFFKEVTRLVNSPQRYATVVIILRVDWLYYLETAARGPFPNLSVHSYFTLDPLRAESARDAIVKPLQTRHIPYSDDVTTEIIRSLQRSQRDEPLGGSFVLPAQLQIVLKALFDHAKGMVEDMLTPDNYSRAGGVERILRTYLADTFHRHPDAWRLLAEFISADGKSTRVVHRSELRFIPIQGNVEEELSFLLEQGFVVASEAEEAGDTHFRLAHDYLVDPIFQHLNTNIDLLGWRPAEQWLAIGTMEWQDSRRQPERDPLLLEKGRYLHIYKYKDELTLNDDHIRLLTRTGLRHGHEGLGYWLSRRPDWEDLLQIVVDELLSTEAESQQNACKALKASVKVKGDAKSELSAPAKVNLAERLLSEFKTSASHRRDAAASALWMMQDFHSRRDQFLIGMQVLRRWVFDHRTQVASYFALVFVLLGLMTGGLLIRERLRGKWISIYSLKAGATPLIAVAPDGRQHVITMGGPGPREGASLFVQEGNGWRLISRDFAKGWPTAMVILPGSTQPTFVVAVHGLGILRSQDAGATWEISNTGLPSHGITALVADRDQTGIIYAATDDWRGVLRSVNGGISWDFFDQGDEIFGASISALAYSRVNGGYLLAGTQDGRILAHRRDAHEWEMRSGWPKGAISAIATAPSDERQIYAGTTRGIMLRSQDGGANWEVLGQIENDFNIRTVAVATDDPERLFVSAYGNGGNKVWMSTDGGMHWQRTEGPGLPRTWISSLAAIGKRPYRLLASTADGLFASTDMGQTWGKEPLGAPLASIQGIALDTRQPKRVWIVNNGSIYVNDGSLLSEPRNQEHEWMAGKGLRAEIVRSLVLDPVDPNVAYAGVLLLGEWSVFVTRDGGRTWRLTTPPAIQPVVPDTTALAIGLDSQGKSVLYAGTLGCGIFRSLDGGQSWDTFGRSRCDQVTDMPSDIAILALDSQNSNVIYAASGQTIFVSMDGGQNWQQQQPKINSAIMGMTVDAVHPGVLYFVAGTSGFWRSNDRGMTWQPGNSKPFAGTELSTVTAIPGQADHLLVGATNGGIWRTSDGGRTWRSIRENLTIGPITGIGVSQDLAGKILLGSASDGLSLFLPGQLLGITE
jgi:photosystem II stability/assembly factor-like uncharacterized protein